MRLPSPLLSLRSQIGPLYSPPCWFPTCCAGTFRTASSRSWCAWLTRRRRCSNRWELQQIMETGRMLHHFTFEVQEEAFSIDGKLIVIFNLFSNVSSVCF